MRPIDADAITYCSYDLDNYHWFRAVDEDEIAEMPTLTLDDLRPKGRWVYSDFVSPTLECSLCGGLAGMDCCGDYHSERSDYCPTCGADMRGGGEDA